LVAAALIFTVCTGADVIFFALRYAMGDRRNRERRGSGRSRVLKGVKLVLGKSSAIDCVVRNVTNSGARIHLPNTVDSPEAFDLTFDVSAVPNGMAISY